MTLDSDDVVTELLINGTWVDISADVRLGHVITRGRGDWLSRVSPGRCSLSLHDPTGKYSPRNPLSPYFGLIGRNTELRVRIAGHDETLDTFTRTESDGWGLNTRGQEYTILTGTVDASVTGTRGRLSVPSAPINRFAYVPGPANVDLTVTVIGPVLATGADLKSGVVARLLDADNFYSAQLQFNTDQTMYLEVNKQIANVDTVIATDTTTGLTHTAGTAYRVRFQTLGTNLRAKCWLASVSEPAAWNVETADGALTAAGGYGVRARVSAGNTNATPVLFDFDDFVTPDVRFYGEVSSWPPKWNIAGTDVSVPIEASGILRRLGQGASPLRSALYRWHSAGQREAYWPMEDESGATQFAEAAGGLPMSLNANVNPAGDSELIGSAPLPVLNTGARIVGTVPAHATTAWTVEFIAKIAYAGTPDTPLAEWYTTGSPSTWRLTMTAGSPPGLRLHCFDTTGAPVAAFDLIFNFTATDGRGILGEWLGLVVSATQNGANIDYDLHWYVDNQLWGGSASDAGTVGAVAALQFGAPALGAALDGTAVGHLNIHDHNTTFFGSFGAFFGVDPESAGARLARLCTEEGVPLVIIGDAADTEAMGPQRVATFLDLLHDCAETDGGILYERRDFLGLAYRTRKSLYNQTGLALDYTAGQIGPPLEPVEDDQAVRNDITVSRRKGSSARATLETGPLSVQSPPNGVGRYDEAVTVEVFADDQLEQIATWRRHLGTWDEARYPTVMVNLAAPDVVVNPALVDAVAALEIGGYLSIDNPPAWLPPDLIELHAQGATERIDPPLWDITVNATPAVPFAVGVYDADASRYDTDGSTINEDLTTTETDVTVVTTGAATGSPLWSTTASDFDIAIGGERMTVTTVTGASSPQTFTVVRSVNGVVKTHSSGATVSLWRPARYAL